jgi:hypothetical protein
MKIPGILIEIKKFQESKDSQKNRKKLISDDSQKRGAKGGRP